ncbi:MAG: METTL5 family protein [Halobacteriota archaeon]|nr:METTL5 family protein [Halobacteriota archaeon]
MRRRELEIILEKVRRFSNPDVTLEQYVTPAPVAAEVLHFGSLKGDLNGAVYDLGCGTGILAIGAKILGAKKVTGFDVDSSAIEVASENATDMGVDVEFICCDVSEVEGTVNTVVMNPPFGAQVRESDRKFINKAIEVGDVVYSIHNEGSEEFIKRFISPNIITDRYIVEFPIKRTFKFHKSDTKVINVEVYRIEKKNEGLKES